MIVVVHALCIHPALSGFLLIICHLVSFEYLLCNLFIVCIFVHHEPWLSLVLSMFSVCDSRIKHVSGSNFYRSSVGMCIVSQLRISTTHECGMVVVCWVTSTMHECGMVVACWVTSVCLSLCVSSFGSKCWMPRPGVFIFDVQVHLQSINVFSYLRVVGSRLRSQEQKCLSVYRACGWSSFDWKAILWCFTTSAAYYLCILGVYN